MHTARANLFPVFPRPICRSVAVSQLGVTTWNHDWHHHLWVQHCILGLTYANRFWADIILGNNNYQGVTLINSLFFLYHIFAQTFGVGGFLQCHWFNTVLIEKAHQARLKSGVMLGIRKFDIAKPVLPYTVYFFWNVTANQHIPACHFTFASHDHLK